MILLETLAIGQQEPQNPPDLAAIQGHVYDANGKPLKGASVLLRVPSGADLNGRAVTTYTDATGAYRFEAVHPGTFLVDADLQGHTPAISNPVTLAQNEIKSVDLTLGDLAKLESSSATSSPRAKNPHDAQAPDFYDEPQFTVAGVTQATNSGGHGADTAARTTEALAKATVSLNTESNTASRNDSSIDPNAGTSAASQQQSLRDAVASDPADADANRRLGRALADKGKLDEALPFLQHASQLKPDDAEAHRVLGEVEEKLGNPLEAVREYQRAAEIQPSETNLFEWGTELLTHRALEPATEVFTRGNHLYPKSVRMLIGLGVAWYARGSFAQAVQFFSAASDLDPANPTPYLFLGKMQSAEIATVEDSVDRLKRFARLQPDNALANYYYALSLWKQSATKDAGDHDPDPARRTDISTLAESLLQKAVQLDPKLGSAYLQLGILYSDRGDFTDAIPAYQKAIELIPEVEPTLAQAHYRLAQAYLRTGDHVKAKKELELRQQADLKAKQETQNERHEIQEFVITLGKQNSEPPAKP